MSMDCRECKDQLGPYLDGDLSRERSPMLRAELDGHLARCPGCRQLFDTCHQTIQAYRRQPAPPLPRPLHRRVMQEIVRQKRPPIPPAANLNP